MCRLLVVLGIGVIVGSAHHESAALNRNHRERHAINGEHFLLVHRQAQARVISCRIRAIVGAAGTFEPIAEAAGVGSAIAGTAAHPVTSTGGALGINLRLAGVAAIIVLDPLEHVAAHVIQAQLIGSLGRYHVSRVS